MTARRKKILIVDDEVGVRELLKESLEQRGYDTATAADGEEGFEQASLLQPDLILLDLVMPKADGWQMLTRLRQQERTRNILVVMLTAQSDTEALLRSAEQKTLDYFIKPFNMDELLAYIGRYL